MRNFNYGTTSDDTLTITIVGVIVGFALATGWDLWKNYLTRKGELKRACRILLQEAEINFRVFRLNLQMLKQDNEEADKNSEVVNQPDHLSISSGESIFLRGSLEKDNPELAIKLRNIYAGMASINHNIEGRELYRATNGAMSNYSTRRKIINEELINLLTSFEKQLQEFIPKVEKILRS